MQFLRRPLIGLCGIGDCLSAFPNQHGVPTPHNAGDHIRNQVRRLSNHRN